MTTYKFSDIDLTKLSVAKVRDNSKMRSFFIDYDGELFTVQTPKLLLDWGGIPQKDEYHPTDADRHYVLYGLKPQPMSKTFERSEEHEKRSKELDQFETWLLELEQWANSEAVLTKLFKKQSNDFMPLVKNSSDGGPSKVKFKFYADRETGDPDFALARLNPETKQRDFELTDGLSLEDLRSKVFRYMGHQRLIFQMRGWTDKLTKRTPRFGLTFIIKCVEYTPPIKREPKQTKADIRFIDSDEEEELQNAEDNY